MSASELCTNSVEPTEGADDEVQEIRKERAVGVVPKRAVVYEQLEELAISAASHLVDMPVPFCAFNGGADVFVDIGNKSLGLHALMKFLDAKSEQVRVVFFVQYLRTRLVLSCHCICMLL